MYHAFHWTRDRKEAREAKEKSQEANSDILLRVYRGLIFEGLLLFVGACVLLAAQSPQQSQATPQSLQQNPQKPLATAASPSQQTAPTQAPAQGGSSAQQVTPAQSQTLQVVVLDPAHGGADTGARGVNGVAEKDIVLEFAHETETALRAEGFQVVLTRQGDTDPSADDRATIANGQSNAIFISLHVASTGPLNTVRTYTYLFPGAVAVSPTNTSARPETPAVPPAGFLIWREAQKPYLVQSQKLGDLMQVELAQKFKSSPEVSSSAPVFGLRSITAPAVAVEVSSVAANPQQLEAMATPLAQGIARAVAAYKTIYPPGGR